MTEKLDADTEKVETQAPQDQNVSDVAKGSITGVPGHLDMYILLFGLFIGFLASPWSLGRLDGELYERLFLGRPTSGVQAGVVRLDPWGDVQKQAELMGELQRKHDEGRERLKDTDSALEDFENQAAIEMERARTLFLDLQRVKEKHIANYEKKLNVIMMGLFLAGVFLMAMEALVSPMPPRSWDQWRGRLIHVRFFVLATLLALVIARPGYITDGLMTWAVLLAGGGGLLVSAPWLIKRTGG